MNVGNQGQGTSKALIQQWRKLKNYVHHSEEMLRYHFGYINVTYFVTRTNIMQS